MQYFALCSRKKALTVLFIMCTIYLVLPGELFQRMHFGNNVFGFSNSIIRTVKTVKYAAEKHVYGDIAKDVKGDKPALPSDSETPEIVHPRLIAHAGGSIYGFCYTNSLEALDSSYEKGFKFIELDFEWTSDGEIVCIHDWETLPQRLFMETPRRYSFEEFKNSKTFMDLTLMDIYSLSEWLKEHTDVYIITDIKSRNLEMLSKIKKEFPEMQKRLIPQIYSQSEYEGVKKLGYENIIFTLYLSKSSDDEVIDFIKSNPLFGVTMEIKRALNTDIMKKIGTDLPPVYIHNVSSLHEYEQLRKLGIYGIYTHYFEPNNWVE